MAFVHNKKKVETIIKENSQAFIDESNLNMLYDPKFEIVVAKSLSSKSKSLRHWDSNGNTQHHMHHKMLENKIFFQGSPSFEPEEAGE